jgi:hypothetical protein
VSDEIVVLDLGGDDQRATQRVTRGVGPGRRGLALIGAVLVAWVAVALLVSADEDAAAPVDTSTTTTADEASSTSTSRRSTTTTIPPTLDRVLPGAEGLRAVISGSPGGAVVDLGTGEIQRTGGEGGTLAVPGGTVLVESGRATFSREDGEEVDLGGADWGLPAPGSGVWLLTESFDGQVIRLVGLDGRQRMANVTVPLNAYPVGSSFAAGVLLQAAGRIYRLDPSGDGFRHVADGEFVSAAGTKVVYTSCDERLRCTLAITDALTGRTRALDQAVTVDSRHGYKAVLSPDGSLLALWLSDDAPNFSIIDVVSSGRPGTVFPLSAGAVNAAAWTPDGRWLVYAARGGLHAVDRSGQQLELDADVGPIEPWDMTIS